MKNRIFSRSIQFLIVGLLVGLAVFRNQWAAIAVVTAWLLFMAGRLLYVNWHRFACWFKRTIPRQQAQPKVSPEPQMSEQSQLLVVPDVLDLPLQASLRHLNCRISDKLKSAFPDVTWNWVAEQPEQIAMQGGTGRITLHQAGEFTHAEVIVDHLARIDFKMIKMMDMSGLLSNSLPQGDIPDTEPANTDATAWFELVGREQLTAIITELNTRNHSRLSIAENGDVYAVDDGTPVKQGNLENLPGKSFWKELSTLISAIGIKVQVNGEQLCLTW